MFYHTLGNRFVQSTTNANMNSFNYISTNLQSGSSHIYSFILFYVVVLRAIY